MSDEKNMHVFFEALADELDRLSDEELLKELREEGRSPEDVAKQARLLLQTAMKAFKQRALVAAKEQYKHMERRLAAMTFQLPSSPTERRQLLDVVVTRHKQAGRMLIAQYRDFKEMTDSDVESWLQQFGALGLLDAKPESTE